MYIILTDVHHPKLLREMGFVSYCVASMDINDNGPVIPLIDDDRFCTLGTRARWKYD